MPRETPREPPSAAAVAAAVAEAVADGDESAAGPEPDPSAVSPFEEGLNAVFHVGLGDSSVVCKTATVSTDAELLAAAEVLRRVGAETTVPVPSVEAVLEPTENSPLDVAAVLLEYVDGRVETDIRALDREMQTAVIDASGTHLAAIHDLRVADGFGPLRRVGDTLEPNPRFETWPEFFDSLAADAVGALDGEGFTADAEPRFDDLSDEIRSVLTGAADESWAPAPSILLGDYRPANLVLSRERDIERPIRAVLDLGAGPTADALADFALAENALVEIPFGGTDRAAVLRDRLRTAYFDRQDVDRSVCRTERFALYRLYAHARRLGAFDYWAQFAHESARSATEARLRGSVRDLLDRLD